MQRIATDSSQPRRRRMQCAGSRVRIEKKSRGSSCVEDARLEVKSLRVSSFQGRSSFSIDAPKLAHVISIAPRIEKYGLE